MAFVTNPPCPRCGRGTEYEPESGGCECPACGLVEFPDPDAVLRHEENWALVLRACRESEEALL